MALLSRRKVKEDEEWKEQELVVQKSMVHWCCVLLVLCSTTGAEQRSWIIEWKATAPSPKGPTLQGQMGILAGVKNLEDMVSLS